MKLYHPTKGIKGIRSVLKQFNEALLSEWRGTKLMFSEKMGIERYARWFPEDYPVKEPGDLVVLDSIVEFIGPHFERLYFVCSTDIATRISIAVATDHHSSVVAREVLQKMSYVLQTNIKAVLTDNGSEFLAYFQKACEDEQIAHFFSRPRTPKDNPVAERFNKSLQQGFYWRCDLTQPLPLINAALADWLIEFNTIRPHESLEMRPPAAVYFNLFYKPRFNPEVHLKLWNRTLH